MQLTMGDAACEEVSGHGAKRGESDLFHERERVESERERAGRRVSGEKKIKFLAETCSNSQFL